MYYGARYYDPRTSVWQSPDPILGGYLNGKPNYGVFDSSNLNLYAYTAQNPVKYVDPDGLAKKRSLLYPGVAASEQVIPIYGFGFGYSFAGYLVLYDWSQGNEIGNQSGRDSRNYHVAERETRYTRVTRIDRGQEKVTTVSVYEFFLVDRKSGDVSEELRTSDNLLISSDEDDIGKYNKGNQLEPFTIYRVVKNKKERDKGHFNRVVVTNAKGKIVLDVASIGGKVRTKAHTSGGKYHKHGAKRDPNRDENSLFKHTKDGQVNKKRKLTPVEKAPILKPKG